MLTRSIFRSGLALGMFALVTVGFLSVVYVNTKQSIALAEREAASKALLEIVPIDRHSNDLLTDVVPVPSRFWKGLGLKKGGAVHIARSENEVIATIVPAVAQDGYSGAINMIVGINRDGTLAGVRVVKHTETPGLGDRVELRKSQWILDFDGKSLANTQTKQWRVKKNGGEFDQFTGATITPRAVVEQVHRALLFFDEFKIELLQDSVPESGTTNSKTSGSSTPASNGRGTHE